MDILYHEVCLNNEVCYLIFKIFLIDRSTDDDDNEHMNLSSQTPSPLVILFLHDSHFDTNTYYTNTICTLHFYTQIVHLYIL